MTIPLLMFAAAVILLAILGWRDKRKKRSNEMFKNHDKLIEVVRQCVNEYDSMGLLKDGCPEDEYEAEIQAIAESLRPGSSPDEIWLIVCNTLHWYFGRHDEPVQYWRKHRELANAICKELPTVDAVPT